MKVFYAARVARQDLLRAVGHLACHLTKWDSECDRRLHRLMSYVWSTIDHRLCAWIREGELAELSLFQYSDADHVGDQKTSRSTSGGFLAVEGPQTFFPLSAVCKRQTAVSHSTP